LKFPYAGYKAIIVIGPINITLVAAPESFRLMLAMIDHTSSIDHATSITVSSSFIIINRLVVRLYLTHQHLLEAHLLTTTKYQQQV